MVLVCTSTVLGNNVKVAFEMVDFMDLVCTSGPKLKLTAVIGPTDK